MNDVVLRQKTPDELASEWLTVLTNHMGQREGFDSFAMCLISLLEALHWKGGSRKIIEAMPHGSGAPTPEDLRDTLVRLGFETLEFESSPSQINGRLLPCLSIDSRGVPTVMLESTDQGYLIIDGREPQRTKYVHAPRPGRTYVVRAIEKSGKGSAHTVSTWTRQALKPFRKLIYMSMGISFFINVLALVAPITIMTVYDQVIGKESPEMLVMLMIGVALAAVFETGMRVLRAWSQAYVGSRLDYVVGGQVFQQILHLSPTFTERAPVGGQVTRMREFETFREVFTGPLASLIMDLPFSLIFVAAIAVIAGPLAVIPVVLTVLYILLAFVVTPELKARNRIAGEARSKRHAFLVEMMWLMRSIKQNGIDDTWRERCRTLSANTAQANYGVARQYSFTQNASQTLMTIAGVATLGFGVMRAMDGDMSLGALIATMILVWRVLSPIQTLFGLIHRIEQLQQSVAQLVGVLNYEREQEPGDAPTTAIRFQGRITMNRVSMRYTSDANAALLGISLDIQPGEILGVAGDSGSGKTSLAKLILGLYRPQGGSISIDGIDIRQLRPISLRQTISYVPQRNHAFPGSLLDNIRLADPGASIERIRLACEMAGIMRKIDAFPHGLNTTFKEGLQSHLPAGFLRQLALARAFLRDAPIYVLDEPALSLEDNDEQAFLDTLNRLRGQATVVMITQRPSHMRMCDKLLVLDDGQIKHYGPTERVLAEQQAARSAKPPTTS